MLHPRLALLALVVAPPLARAEEAPPKSRPISPYIARVLAGKMPAFEAATPKETKPAEGSAIFYEVPRDPSVVVLPKVVVSEGRLPAPGEVGPSAAEIRALERQAMNHYLGSIDGLDRGFLNRFTIGQAWKKIPVLGTWVKTPFWLTNEERAMMKYKEDQEVRREEQARDLERLLRLGSPPASKKP